jgi:hypothetical protein
MNQNRSDVRRRDSLKLGSLAVAAMALATSPAKAEAQAAGKKEPRYIRHDPPRVYAKACVYGDPGSVLCFLPRS